MCSALGLSEPIIGISVIADFTRKKSTTGLTAVLSLWTSLLATRTTHCAQSLACEPCCTSSRPVKPNLPDDSSLVAIRVGPLALSEEVTAIGLCSHPSARTATMPAAVSAGAGSMANGTNGAAPSKVKVTKNQMRRAKKKDEKARARESRETSVVTDVETDTEATAEEVRSSKILLQPP